MNKKFSIGIDFGTESGRTVLVDIGTGEEVATSVYHYSNGVIDERLPEEQSGADSQGSKRGLPPDFALQDPEDYIRTLETTIPAVLRESGVRAEDVVGIGVDFTSCTMLPVYRDGRPLCLDPRFRGNPHAWVKLWKHHAAQPYATRLNEIALEREEEFLTRYGGKISSEWFFPKVWEILDKAPEIYAAADRMIEAADWIVWQLTGIETRNSCTAGYKAMWDKRRGFPSDAFFAALDPRLEHVISEKMSRDILPLGTRAGGLLPDMAEKTGLSAGTSVAVGNVDAHAAVPATTVVEPGKLVMVMGTSICHMLLGRQFRLVEGMCGVVEDGILPGLYGFEAGQSAVGDIFAWFVENGVPGAYGDEARRKGISIYDLLEEKARVLRPGESGLLVLDWWNGNRSILVDADLSGLIVGLTLRTKPEEIYRALIEGTAFGTATIIEAFSEKGLAVDEIYACGGLTKNRLLMQIFADVTGREIRVSASSQTPALGAAMFGAVAAGRKRGGYDTIVEAARHMAHLKDDVFRPNSEAHSIYRKIFLEYKRLHDYFGRGENDIMKVIKGIKSIAGGGQG